MKNPFVVAALIAAQAKAAFYHALVKDIPSARDKNSKTPRLRQTGPRGLPGDKLARRATEQKCTLRT